MKFAAGEGTNLLATLAVMVLLGGCASSVPEPVKPATPAAAPVAPAKVKGFQADLLGRGDCPPGQALFAVPWEYSPRYSPLITFIRAPDPVKTCIPFPETLVPLYLGRKVPLERLPSGAYQLQSATAPVTR
jgi:hypothetical protein